MAGFGDLKRYCAEHGVTGCDVALILGLYADDLEVEHPDAANEIANARDIGLNIKDILDEVTP